MSTVQIQSQIELDLDDILNGIALLDSSQLEQFARRVISLSVQRRVSNLSPTEVELLTKINYGVEQHVRERYHELDDKLHEDNISANEHQELLSLIEQIEIADAERVHALHELSQLRNVPIDDLMTQLGITPPTYA